MKRKIIQTVKRNKDEEIKTKINTYENQSAKYYASREWRALRAKYFVEHPICEICKMYGAISSAEEIHHALPFLRGTTEEERYKLLTDQENLISLCKKCHRKIHQLDNIYHYARLDYLNYDQWIDGQTVTDN